MSFNCYADNTQLHISCKLSELAKLSSLHNCLAAVEKWTAGNFLQLKSNKNGNPHYGPLAHFFNFCLLVALYLNTLRPVLRSSEFMYQTLILAYVMTC